jgi:hypothetical protein
MADWNVATGAEQAINRTGAPNCQVVGEDVQGTLVGVSQNADDEWELVEADAEAEASGGTEINALGVLFPEEVVDLDALPTGAYLADIEEQLVQENKTLAGDRAVFIVFGVEMINNDEDTNFTPNQPVYLDTGGGFTQTKPSTTGDIQQAVGVCLPPNEDGGSNRVQGDRIYLDVDLTTWTTA